MKSAEQIFPIYKVEHDAMLSVHGELTIAFELILPELFTLSNDEYEAFHQAWIKAIKVLPKQTVFHKQDWFLDSRYKANFENKDSFLCRSSERFFNERPS